MTKKKATKKVAKKKVSSTKRSTPKGDYDLVVVESPSKAKTIKKYLGKGYTVVACNGHIKDLPKSKLGVDVKNFSVDLVAISGKSDKLDRIRELAKKAGKIYLAPDMDREGEAIAFHLSEEIKNKRKIHRVVFNAVTKAAVRAAIEAPVKLRRHMYESQQTRRILDRLVGYKISPLLWEKVQRGISAGRVQSVALRLIVEREESIKAFVPKQWFSIEGDMEKDKTLFEIKYYGEEKSKKTELTDEALAKKIVKAVKGKPFEVVEIKKRERKQSPGAPFTTSKLQQDAANRLGFSAKRTMMVAQKLYEGVALRDHGMQGLITYMRTDSVRTAPEALETVRSFIKKEYGKDYLPGRAIVHKGKAQGKTQDAHEAIRPTNVLFTPQEVRGDLTEEQHKLYTLIWNKFVSSQMAQAVIDQTSVMFKCQGHFFNTSGSVIKFPGFRTVGPADSRSKDAQVLPSLEKGEKLKCKKGPSLQEHWTTPPPRYNDASVVKDLEEKGIGRPSTYASIISNIQDRGYVDKTERRFMPTELGIVVCRLLIASFPKIMDVGFTAGLEESLDKIEEGEIKYKKILKDFWKDFEVTLNKAKEEMKNLKRQVIPSGIKCKKCKEGEYMVKWGRNGQFLACSAYPDCNSTFDFKRDLDENIHLLPKNWFHSPCPECGKKMEVKTGRYGRFVRCEEYPKCETTGPYFLPINCPECVKGNFVEKKSRYGKIFYACSSWPDCSNAMWSQPYEYDCPGCGYPLMVYKKTKRQGEQLACPKCKHLVDWGDTPFAKALAADSSPEQNATP